MENRILENELENKYNSVQATITRRTWRVMTSESLLYGRAK